MSQTHYIIIACLFGSIVYSCEYCPQGNSRVGIDALTEQLDLIKILYDDVILVGDLNTRIENFAQR